MASVRFVGWLFIVFSLFIVTPSFGAESIVYGPQTFTVDKSQALIATDNFPSSDGSTELIIRIINGTESGRNRVTTGSVTLNGVEVVASSDLSQQVGLIEEKVAILPSNELSVDLGGKSGSYVTITVFEYTQDPQPEGSFGSQYEDLIPADATKEIYDPKRFSLITGKVSDQNDAPIEGVTVSVGATSCTQCHGHQYGTVTTNIDGEFTLPVEGGSTITVAYEKDGLIASHRQVYVPWNDIAAVEPIQMIPFDTAATTFTFDGNPNTVVSHLSTPVTDSFGTRSATMIFTGDNAAYAVDAGGNVLQQLSTITSRATEFSTPGSMPAVLPPNSGYTYCVEMSVDGAERVRFDKPVISWVDNFLGFQVGGVVPVGYYDRDQGKWISSENGTVVRLLDTDLDGAVDALDSDGDSLPNDLNGDGSFSDEVIGLNDSSKYLPNSTYWRFSVTHFTPWDCNWPFKPPSDAISPNSKDDSRSDEQEKPERPVLCDKTNVNSYVRDRDRVYHEDIPIPGTAMTLHYASNRVPGYKAKVTVPVSGSTVPSSLKRIVVKMTVAGRRFAQSLSPLPNQRAEFVWDGLDNLGRQVNGKLPAYIRIGFVYDAVYMEPGEFAEAFAQFGSSATTVRARQEIILWRKDYLDVTVQSPENALAKGWTLSHQHQQPRGDILLKGDGTLLSNDIHLISHVADASGTWGDITTDPAGNLYYTSSEDTVVKIGTNGEITTIAGNGRAGFGGDGSAATKAKLNDPSGLAFDAEGNLYIADFRNYRVRKVDPNGIITTVAGTGDSAYSGDGGLATEAQLERPFKVAIDSVGNLYITSSTRIRKVSSSGIITTVAGNGTTVHSGDGGPAITAGVGPINYITCDAKDNLYVATGYLSGGFDQDRIRKIDSSGIITTVAGNGFRGFSGDGGAATLASLNCPASIAVDAEGCLYIADYTYSRIRKVDQYGIINTIAGSGDTLGSSGDGGPASEAVLGWPHALSFDPLGNLYLKEHIGDSIRKISLDTVNSFIADRPLGYQMADSGEHLKTIDLATGKDLQSFGYSPDGDLETITDQFGNVTRITWVNGMPTAITSPDDLVTSLTVDQNTGHLTHVTYPDLNNYYFEYSPEGLMTLEVDPAGNRFTHIFDTEGRVTDVQDEEGGHWNYAETVLANGWTQIQKTTIEGDVTQYLGHSYAGATTISSTGPSGGVSSITRTADGLSATKTSSCGTDLTYRYGIDSELQYKYVKEETESTPLGRLMTTTWDKVYQDTDADDTPDLITETVTVNDKATILTTNTLLSQKTVTSPEGRIVTSSHDPATLVTTSTSVSGLHDVAYGYDSKGRLTSISQDVRQSLFTYTPQGFLDSVTDPESRTTTYDHDALGRVTGIHRPDTSLISFTYDNNGNMTMLTNPSSIGQGFGYNKVDKKSSYQTPLSGSYQYVYDRDRRLTDVHFPSGLLIKNIYLNGQLSQTQTPEGNIDYSYLCSTKLGSMSKGTESISYGYDGKLVTSATLTGTLAQSISFVYNNDFNVTDFTYAGATESYSYDNDGLLTSAGNFTITRNAGNGLPESVSDASFSLARTFNGYGEIDGESVTVGPQSVTSYSLTRDLAGRILTKAETIAGTTVNNVYTYDSMGRLRTVTRDGTLSEEYRYNANGTRDYEMNTHRGIAGRTLSYNSEDHLLAAGTTTYQYDLDGFLTTRIDGTDVTLYNYSSRGELQSTTLPDGRVVEYIHDPLGRRIAKKIDSVTVEKYLWQGLTRLIAVYDGSNVLKQRFQYADGRMAVTMTKNSTTYYLGYNQVGSLKVVTDSAGSIVKQIDYDSFGNIIADNNPAFSAPFGFAGGLHDRDTNLVRFGYRDYDPEVGRWTAKDPIGFDGGDVDLYGYVWNNPILITDPFGLSSLTFDRSDGTVTVYNDEGQQVGSSPASNNATNPWPNGTFEYSWYNAHPESGPNDAYGDSGIHIFDVDGRTGMGIHAGRQDQCADGSEPGGYQCNTAGCVRTDEATMQIINNLHLFDPVTTITIQD